MKVLLSGVLTLLGFDISTLNLKGIKVKQVRPCQDLLEYPGPLWSTRSRLSSQLRTAIVVTVKIRSCKLRAPASVQPPEVSHGWANVEDDATW